MRKQFLPKRQPKRRTTHKIDRTQHDSVFRIYRRDGALVTKCLISNEPSCEEKLFVSNEECRVWDPNHSVLAECISRLGESSFNVTEGDCVLCMHSGVFDTAALHLSDLVGENGRVYVIDPDPSIALKYLRISKRRKNVCVINGNTSSILSFQPFLPFFSLVYCVGDEIDPDPGGFLNGEDSAAATLFLRFDARIINVRCRDDLTVEKPLEINEKIQISKSRFAYSVIFNAPDIEKPLTGEINRLEESENNAKQEKDETREDEPTKQDLKEPELEDGEIVDDD